MDWDAAYPVADDAAMRASIGAMQAAAAAAVPWAAGPPPTATPCAPPPAQRTSTPQPHAQTQSATAPIDTTARFLAWFDSATRDAQQAQDHAQHTYSAHLRRQASATHELLDTLHECSAQLAGISTALAATRRLTLDATSSASQTTLDKLARAHDAIAARLLEYDALQPLTAIVRAPGDACLDPRFLPALQRAELAQSRLAGWQGRGRDDELYLLRFAQARTRALALIRMHVTATFRRLARDAADTRALYVAFRGPAGRLRPLVGALEQRCAGAGEAEDEEAFAVLAAVRQAYFGARKAPVRTLVARRFAEIQREHGAGGLQAADVLRDWCAFAMNACADERRVYAEYFDPPVAGPEALDAFIEDVLGVLYEHVRPLVLAQGDVEVVAEMALALLTFQKPSEEEEGEGGQDEGFAPFYTVVDRCVADAQQRLAFRAQSFVGSAIAQYRLTIEDAERLAAWVARCCALHVSDPPMLQHLLADGSGEDVGDLRWEYPPVAACLWLMALVDGCLDPEVQRGIEDEARMACRDNLLAHAARAVRDAPRPTGAQEYNNPENLAHLFVTHGLARIADHHHA